MPQIFVFPLNCLNSQKYDGDKLYKVSRKQLDAIMSPAKLSVSEIEKVRRRFSVLFPPVTGPAEDNSRERLRVYVRK